MSEAVLDASALLAVLYREPGAVVVEPYLGEASMSTVNFAEVITRLADSGLPRTSIRSVLMEYQLNLVPFDESQAYWAGFLRPETRFRGLSFGDHACLSLAMTLRLPAVTADLVWGDLPLGIEVRVIR